MGQSKIGQSPANQEYPTVHSPGQQMISCKELTVHTVVIKDLRRHYSCRRRMRDVYSIYNTLMHIFSRVQVMARTTNAPIQLILMTPSKTYRRISKRCGSAKERCIKMFECTEYYNVRLPRFTCVRDFAITPSRPELTAGSVL